MSNMHPRRKEKKRQTKEKDGEGQHKGKFERQKDSQVERDMAKDRKE